MPTTDNLTDQLRDARRRTLTHVRGLDDSQLMGPSLPIGTHPRWEIGHVACFHEYWGLRRHLGQPPGRADVDALYDSTAIPHAARWVLPLPSLSETLACMDTVLQHEIDCLRRGPDDPRRDYLARYATFHEDMHTGA